MLMLNKFYTMRRYKEEYKKNTFLFYGYDTVKYRYILFKKKNRENRAFHIYKETLATGIIAKRLKNKTLWNI